MAQINIRVATHDNDTTDIELSRNGTKLSVSLGEKKAEIDMAEFIPATQADRFLADATYDEATKELVLTTRKDGEEDKEVRVPISHLFQIEVEEILTKEQGVDFHLKFEKYPIALDDGTYDIEATALGRIKGTDWYVFKFDEAQVNAFRDKVIEDMNRPEDTFDPTPNWKRANAGLSVDPADTTVTEDNYPKYKVNWDSIIIVLRDDTGVKLKIPHYFQEVQGVDTMNGITFEGFGEYRDTPPTLEMLYKGNVVATFKVGVNALAYGWYNFQEQVVNIEPEDELVLTFRAVFDDGSSEMVNNLAYRQTH